MFVMAMILGVLTFYFGFSLLFRFKQFQEMSRKLSRIILDETWFINHRIGIGLLLLGLSLFLFAGAYFITKISG